MYVCVYAFVYFQVLYGVKQSEKYIYFKFVKPLGRLGTVHIYL